MRPTFGTGSLLSSSSPTPPGDHGVQGAHQTPGTALGLRGPVSTLSCKDFKEMASENRTFCSEMYYFHSVSLGDLSGLIEPS